MTHRSTASPVRMGAPPPASLVRAEPTTRMARQGGGGGCGSIVATGLGPASTTGATTMVGAGAASLAPGADGLPHALTASAPANARLVTLVARIGLIHRFSQRRYG
jgi:hypothetical protein